MDALMMLFLALRLLLAGILLMAAAGKLQHRAAFAATLGEFAVPAALRPALAWLMPLTELAIAALLLFAASAWWGAAAGAVLLAIYSAVLACLLQRGLRPSCNCFGLEDAKPISNTTLARNGVLLLMAATLVYAGPAYAHASVWHYLAEAPALSACLAVMLAQWWLLHQVLRQNGRLILRMDNIELRLDAANVQPLQAVDTQARGLVVGSLAPEFTLPEAGGGRPQSLARLRSAGLPVLLIFSDIGCSPCAELAPRIESWHRQFRERVRIAVILRVDTLQTQQPRPPGGCILLLQEDRQVAASYDALVTPSAVLVSAEGTIASHLALGAKDIYDLLQATLPQTYETREIAA
ncbi:MauE/DoxX family redox-associated membrane protein [Duganella sp.]|uniref:peroxiredoxin family protein n=1 Tax=Duganella sp. TaxID=1904440 RepID=UPI0031DEF0EA